MKKILITNDDGIEAGGIIRLAEAAKKYGEVWVVAPEKQRSAASHCITLRDPLDVYPHDFPVEGVKAFSCSGMPADCVRVGSLSVMPERPYAVFSGINLGWNSASDIQYSATAGAAFEAAFQGYRAIAFSEGFSDRHEVTDRYLDELMGKLIDLPFVPGHILNVNFPECALSECRGVLYDRTVSEGMVFKDHYEVIEKLPNGGLRYMVKGVHQSDAEEGSDLRALFDNYVSVGYVNNIGYEKWDKR